MTDTVAIPHEPDQAPRRRDKVAKYVLVAVVLAIALMWIYAFTLAPREGINVFKDEQWAARSEAICKQARISIEALPFVDPADTTPAGFAARADGVRKGTDTLRAMLAELKATEPSDEVGKDLIPKWYKDWDAYLAARDRYVAGLADGSQTEFDEPVVDNSPISNFIDDLARQNRMTNCTVPPLS